MTTNTAAFTILYDGWLLAQNRVTTQVFNSVMDMRVAARREVAMAEQRLGMTPKGEATRDHPDVRPRVTKEMVRMVVEE
jgi:hypothetical protein